LTLSLTSEAVVGCQGPRTAPVDGSVPLRLGVPVWLSCHTSRSRSTFAWSSQKIGSCSPVRLNRLIRLTVDRHNLVQLVRELLRARRNLGQSRIGAVPTAAPFPTSNRTPSSLPAQEADTTHTRTPRTVHIVRPPRNPGRCGRPPGLRIIVHACVQTVQRRPAQPDFSHPRKDYSKPLRQLQSMIEVTIVKRRCAKPALSRARGVVFGEVDSREPLGGYEGAGAGNGSARKPAPLRGSRRALITSVLAKVLAAVAMPSANTSASSPGARSTCYARSRTSTNKQKRPAARTTIVPRRRPTSSLVTYVLKSDPPIGLDLWKRYCA
jgi:hypothetical protein